MLIGGIVGMVIGLLVVLIQKQMKKKKAENSDILDNDKNL